MKRPADRSTSRTTVARGPNALGRRAKWLPRRGSVRATVVVLMGANIIYGACQCLLMVVLVRTCHDIETGRFARGLAISGPIMMCTSLQLRTLLATDAAHEYRWIDYLCARGTMIAASLAVVLIVCLIAGYGWVDAQVVVLVTLVKGVESIGNLIYGYFQHVERTSHVATSMILKGFAMVVGAALGGWLTTKAWGAVSGMLVGIATASIAFDLRWLVRMRRNLTDHSQVPIQLAAVRRSRFSWRPTWKLLRMGIAPGAIVGLNSLSMNVPRYFVDGVLGTVPLGIFTGLASMMRIGSYVELALVQATQTRLSQLARDGRATPYRRMLSRIAAVALFVGLGLTAATWIAGDWIVAATFSPSYAQHTKALVVLMLAGAIGNIAGVLKGATDASRRYAVQLPILMTSLLAAAIGAALLIPPWGIMGAAWSIVITKLTLTGGYVVALTMHFPQAQSENTADHPPLAYRAA